MKKNILLSIFTLSLLTFCGKKHNSHSDHTVSVSAETTTYADSVNSGLIAVDSIKKSTPRVAMGNIGDCHVHVTYHSPGVRGRKIWGELVPYNEVWAAGAHRATTVSFSEEVIIADTTVPAGKYAFFIIPTETSWTLILNANFDQHMADSYNEAEDVLRVIVTPETLEKQVQRLTYSIESIGVSEDHSHHAADRAISSSHPATGNLIFSWENKRVKLPITYEI